MNREERQDNLKVLSNENRGGSNLVSIDPLTNCLVGKCPFPAPNGFHHEMDKNVFSYLLNVML